MSNIKSEWREVALADVALDEKGSIRRGPFGGSLKKEIFVSDGYKVYEQKNAIYDDFEIGEYFIDEDKFEEMKGFSVVPGDILISCAGTLGRIAIVPNDAKPGIINQALTRIRPNPRKVSAVYLKYFLQSTEIQREFFGDASGSAIKNVKAISELKSARFLLPPLSEQKRIADILDKANTIRRKRQEAIHQFGALTESLFQKMFSRELSSVRWTDLSDYLVELRYGTSNKSGEGGYTTLRIPNIVRGIIDLTDLKTVDVSHNELEKLKLLEGDVLFVRTNGNPDYVGRCAVFDPSQMEAAGLDVDKIIYASYLIRGRLHLDRMRPLFLQSLLQTPAGRRNVREKCRTSAGQYNINTKGIGDLQVPIVAVEEQIRFETRVRSFRPVLTSLATAHSEAEALFNSLVQRAFNAEL